MPSCRNCGARLSKFDKDICPVCGTKNPLQGVSSETVEITSQVDLSGFEAGQKVVRRRKKMLLLACLLGFTGAAFFYLKRKGFALIWLFANLVVIAGLVCLFLFATRLPLVVAILIPIAISYVINAIVGVIYFYLPNLKDGEGEFVV